jgi:hypothetical protein
MSKALKRANTIIKIGKIIAYSLGIVTYPKKSRKEDLGLSVICR